MAVDNGIAFIGACGGLVNALGIKGNGPVSLGKPLVESTELIVIKTGLCCDIIEGCSTGIGYCFPKTLGVVINILAVSKPLAVEIMALRRNSTPETNSLSS